MGESNNMVLCTNASATPDSSIPHFYLDDFSFYRGSRNVRKLLLSNVGSSLYFLFKKPSLDKLFIHKQPTVFITIFTFDLLWRTLKFMRLYPDKKYILFMMDNFIDFDDPQEGLSNRKAFTYIANKAYKCLAISKSLANDLENITNKGFDIFYGPRIINWNKVNECHKQEKEHKICFVGNAWVEDVLPIINKQLQKSNVTITWFTSKNNFIELQHKYTLTNFVFGGSLSSEEVINAIANFRYGLILYGLEELSQIHYNRKLQEYSIPSKILDYCMAGIEPIYYGPENTACHDFLSSHELGVLINRSSFDEFLNNFEQLASKPIEFEKMINIAKSCSAESFRELVAQ